MDRVTPGIIFEVDAILLPADRQLPELVKAAFEVAIDSFQPHARSQTTSGWTRASAFTVVQMERLMRATRRSWDRMHYSQVRSARRLYGEQSTVNTRTVMGMETSSS